MFDMDIALSALKIKDIWNKEPFYISGSGLDIEILPNIEELIKNFTGYFEGNHWVSPCDVNINVSRLNSDGMQNLHMNADIKTAMYYFQSGYSICFGDMSVSIDALREFKCFASEIFGTPELIAVTGYLSPPESVGVLHFDRQHNFFIQKQGRKKWLVSAKAAVPNPYDNFVYSGISQSFLDEMKSRGYKIEIPRECGQCEYELCPGDILYVPPGFYHSPETMSDPSLHYTLTIESDSFLKRIQSHIFDSMLASNGLFSEDLRFKNDADIKNISDICVNKIASII